ncbi:MAG: DUF4430 domain-containing protein [Solirubrobacterales bacterium]
MKGRRGLAVAAALLCVVVTVGCGLGPGESIGSIELRVTRDYGATAVVEPVRVKAHESDTVLRLLDGETEVGTRYGGAFVQSVDGVEGAERSGRRYDWFFYVDGVESPAGAADVVPADGQDVWWDYRDWSSAMRVPAVVGAFPEPFEHGFEGHTYRTRIDCLGARAPCDLVQLALQREGVEAGVSEADRAPGLDAEATLRILVGPWRRVGEDPAATLIEEGPATSGVFARFGGQGPAASMTALDERGRAVRRFGPAAGLVAAVRLEDHPPTWVVTGTTEHGVTAAARALSDGALRGRYALIVPPGDAEGVSVPVPGPAG